MIERDQNCRKPPEPGSHDHHSPVGDQLAFAVAELGQAQAEIGHLEAALQNSRMIGIAVGILAERYTIDADRAFALLVRISQTSNRKIRVLAEELVTTGQLTDLNRTTGTALNAPNPPTTR